MIDIKKYKEWLLTTKQSIYPETGAPFSHIEKLRNAAVSIILVKSFNKSKETYSIVFAQRSDETPSHKGQIAFPGGGIHKNEELLETAIRETHEEIGVKIDLNSPEWELLGEYPKKFITISDYLITPFIFTYKPKNGTSLKYKPDQFEITEAFDVPLEHLIDPKNQRREKREWQGQIFNIHFFQYNQRTIWGVTGMLLHDFLQNLILN